MRLFRRISRPGKSGDNVRRRRRASFSYTLFAGGNPPAMIYKVPMVVGEEMVED